MKVTLEITTDVLEESQAVAWLQDQLFAARHMRQQYLLGIEKDPEPNAVFNDFYKATQADQMMRLTDATTTIRIKKETCSLSHPAQ
jgi:hypothetical protein